MNNVWKIGSRWGNAEASVLDLFIAYNCVFFSTDDTTRIGDYLSVKKGDVFIISDGKTPVAIAQALDTFRRYEESGIKFKLQDKEEYIYDKVMLCKASIILLKKEERGIWGNINRNRFSAYRPYDRAQRELALKFWKEHENDKDHGAFDIVCGTFSLLENRKEKPAIFTENRQYQIPIYQRPYSWGENNLRRLLEDLRDAVKNDEPVFMGTIQLSEPIPLDASGIKNAYDIIDGQQRISSFIILLGLLGVLPEYVRRTRTLVNRGNAQDQLDELWKALDNWIETKNTSIDTVFNPYLRNLLVIDVLLDELFDGKDETPSRDNLKEFLKRNVLFVVIETHGSLSKTLKIFNTINTAGLDLGTEDLFKIRFYEYLKQCGKQDDVFDQISDIYARVEQGKKKQKFSPNMGDLLRTYQRIIVSKYNLSNSAYGMSYERFYDQLFDTLLNIRNWPDLKKIKEPDSCFEMSVEELNKLLDCFEERAKLLSINWDFQIMDQFLWETRYGPQMWDYNVIALFFDKEIIGHLDVFTKMLFRLVVPASLFYAKRINPVDSALIGILRLIAQGNNAITVLNNAFEAGGFGYYQNDSLISFDILKEAFAHEITGYPKWKLLICRLVEYLKSKTKDESLLIRLFKSDIDIEHIQCYTDRTDRDKVWTEWGAELNRLGNLVLLESDINRSIGNDSDKKPEGYKKSRFVSANELSEEVKTWTIKDAIKRRDINSKLIYEYIIGKNNS